MTHGERLARAFRRLQQTVRRPGIHFTTEQRRKIDEISEVEAQGMILEELAAAFEEEDL